MRSKAALYFTRAAIEDAPLEELEITKEVIDGWLGREPIKSGFDYRRLNAILSCLSREMGEMIAAEVGDDP